MLEMEYITTLIVGENIGERQSTTIAVSLKISAESRYILHSGSRAVPRRWANRIVAKRPKVDWSMDRKIALVEEAFASPTPMPKYSEYHF